MLKTWFIYIYIYIYIYISVCVFCGFKTYNIFSLASLKETSDSTNVVDYVITIQTVYYNGDTM